MKRIGHNIQPWGWSDTNMEDVFYLVQFNLLFPSFQVWINGNMSVSWESIDMYQYNKQVMRDTVKCFGQMNQNYSDKELLSNMLQKMKFSINDFFSKCDQIHRKVRIWSHLLKKSLMENLIFCAVTRLWS